MRIFPPLFRTFGLFMLQLVILINAGGPSQAEEVPAKGIRDALTFHASFDGKADADFALGDPKLYHAPSLKERNAGKPGLPAPEFIALARGVGKHGDALQFKTKAASIIYFTGEKNCSYATNDWSGTISFWLSTDPQKDLPMGFCDPIQVTPRAWNDAAFFVEFEKRKESIPFRLGAYADFKVWNPMNRKWGEIPFEEKPLVAVDPAPFGGEKWTHVVFTFERHNTGQPDGVVKLYLDGQFRGEVVGRVQTFTWNPAETLILLGLNYVGLFDELSLFNRALTESEIRQLHSLAGGMMSLGGTP